MVKLYKKELIIETFTEKFLTNKYISWLNNRKLMEYSEQRYNHFTIDSCRDYMDSFRNTENLFLAVTLNNEHIGNFTIYIDERNNLADIGILFGEQHGKGYASEAWKLITEYLFNEKKIRKITAGTVSANTPMIKLFERVGMTPDGIRKRHYIIGGFETDVLYYCLFNQ